MEDDRPFEDDNEPLDEEEREALEQDLVDVQVLREILGPKGLRGTVFYCPDCEEDHFLTWELLEGNLRELIDAGESPIHEPAFDPNPDEYVPWDYARGFLDGYESFEREELGEVTVRLVMELESRGLRAEQVAKVLSSVGLELPEADEPGGGPSLN
ncbi:MAG: DUF5319 family protein [Actinobacteria bacterium]|nr:DUF5319 family protein [Actinomycetota bacterium]